MGTSKSYVTLTGEDFTKVKRSITSLIKCKPAEKANKKVFLVNNFGHALRTETTTKKQIVSSVSRIIDVLFALNKAYGTSSEFEYDEIKFRLDEFKTAYEFFVYVNSFDKTFTIVDQLSKDALYDTLNLMELETIEDIVNVDMDLFLLNYLSSITRKIFLQHYFELISQKKPDDAISLSNEICEFISSMIEKKVKIVGIKSMLDYEKLSDYIDSIVDDVFGSLEVQNEV